MNKSSDSDEVEGCLMPVYHTILSEEDFNLSHTVWYYLYTDHITFGSNIDAQISNDFPKLCSTEDIYMIADRMQLEELKEKALQFLKLSCTPENITSRIMSKFSELHKEVEKIYGEYFRTNWDLIKNKEEFKKFFTDENEDLQDNLKEVMRVMTKLLELMKDASFR